jgi:hypothetical protein
MAMADAIILVLPAGKSSHLELGYGTGSGQTTAILLDEKPQPELMYNLAGLVTPNLEELVEWLDKVGN